MNNDSTPSSAADLPSTSTATDTAAGENATEATSEPTQNAQTPAQKKAQVQTKKKYEFVNTLMTNLDILIYAELCILYYME